ncbi:MAG: hypothetical protein ACK51N_00515 [bacterium]|jgi:hypothetical protein
MRWLVRRLYRAFPELDPFSDQECRAFVHRARWSKRHVLVHPALLLGTWTVLAASYWGLVLWLLDAPVTKDGQWWWWVWRLVVGVLAAAAVLLAGLRVRHVLLRRAVAALLAARGACDGCGHGMVGVLVGEQGAVCPECALVKRLAEGEAVMAEDGRERFLPRPEGAALAIPWTARLRPVMRKVGLAATGVVVIAAVYLAVNEVRIQIDTRGYAEMLAREAAPRGVLDARLARAMESLGQIVQGREAAFVQTLEFRLLEHPDLALAPWGLRSDWLTVAPEEFAANAVRAVAIGQLQEASVRRVLEALISETQPDSSGTAGAVPATSQLTSMIHGVTCWMVRQALVSAEVGRWADAAKWLIRADEIGRRVGSVSGAWVIDQCLYSQSLLMQGVCRLMMERPPDEFIKPMLRSAVFSGLWVSDQQVWEVVRNRLFARAFSRFRDAEDIRWLPWHDPRGIYGGSGRPSSMLSRLQQPLGRLQEHVDAADKLTAAMRAWAPTRWMTFSTPTFPPTGVWAIDAAVVKVPRAVDDVLDQPVHLAALHVAVAAEGFALRTGSDPSSLADLLGSPELPVLPAALAGTGSGVGLAMHTFADGHARPIVYLFGPDGQDNAGGRGDILLHPLPKLIGPSGAPWHTVDPDRPVFIGSRLPQPP